MVFLPELFIPWISAFLGKLPAKITKSTFFDLRISNCEWGAMLLFAAGIFSDRGADIPDPQGDPGKGREGKNIRIWDFVTCEKRPQKGRNPRTGEQMIISGRRDLTFRPAGCCERQGTREIKIPKVPPTYGISPHFSGINLKGFCSTKVKRKGMKFSNIFFSP
jgi:hypothetical protein